MTGQGVLGLQAAVLAAGARSMLLSLWKVPDEAARRFMELYYTALWIEKMPKVEALQRAQAAMRTQSKFAHPIGPPGC